MQGLVGFLFVWVVLPQITMIPTVFATIHHSVDVTSIHLIIKIYSTRFFVQSCALGFVAC